MAEPTIPVHVTQHFGEEVTRLREEDARLREALKPFAEAAARLDDETALEIGDFPVPEGLGLMVLDLIEARRALEER